MDVWYYAFGKKTLRYSYERGVFPLGPSIERNLSRLEISSTLGHASFSMSLIGFAIKIKFLKLGL